MLGRVLRAIRVPLTLLILLGLLCYGAWWGWTRVVAPTPKAPVEPCIQQNVSKGQLKSSQVTVNVFNGGHKRGLAGDVAKDLNNAKFKIGKVGNTDRSVSGTVIVGAGAKNPEVLLVKGFLKGAKIRVDKRANHSVDVLVGNSYGGFNKKAKTSIAVKGKSVCLPAGPSSHPASK